MTLWFDPYLFVILISLIGLALWARLREVHARRRAAGPAARSGRETAGAILSAEGLADIRIAAGSGPLAEFYDPTLRTVLLPDELIDRATAEAAAAAIREAGHAIRREQGKSWARLRVPLTFAAILGRDVAWLVLAAGLILDNMRIVGLGVSAFEGTLLAAALLLPIEVDAIRHGRRAATAAGVALEPAVLNLLSALEWRPVGMTLPSLPRFRRGVAPRGGQAPA